MTWHPTTNLVQTDLLKPEQQKALYAWPHGYEYYCDGEWIEFNPSWLPDKVYRAKPAPVVTSVWFNCYNDGMSGPCRTRKMADQGVLQNRIDVLRIDTCNGVSTVHLEGLQDE